jgi:F0F1-type ATP synthase membrane subunit b/b'
MNAITGIITALGIDSTLFVQLGVFALVFLVLKYVAFDAYFAAFTERQKRTEGNQIHADKLLAQTRELETLYQRKARELNADVKAIFDRARLEATLEQEKIFSEAREKSKATVDRAREHIQGEINRAREDLLKEAPVLARSIAERLMNQEVKQ